MEILTNLNVGSFKLRISTARVGTFIIFKS